MKQRIDLEKATRAEVFSALAVGADRKHRSAGVAGRTFTPAQTRALSGVVRSLVHVVKEAGAEQSRVSGRRRSRRHQPLSSEGPAISTPRKAPSPFSPVKSAAWRAWIQPLIGSPKLPPARNVMSCSPAPKPSPPTARSSTAKPSCSVPSRMPSIARSRPSSKPWKASSRFGGSRLLRFQQLIHAHELVALVRQVIEQIAEARGELVRPARPGANVQQQHEAIKPVQIGRAS